MWDHETIMMIVQGVGETLYMTVLSHSSGISVRTSHGSAAGSV